MMMIDDDDNDDDDTFLSTWWYSLLSAFVVWYDGNGSEFSSGSLFGVVDSHVTAFPDQ